MGGADAEETLRPEQANKRAVTVSIEHSLQAFSQSGAALLFQPAARLRENLES